MVLQALTRYYDILANDPDTDIAPPNFSLENVSFAIELSQNGDLINIYSLFEYTVRGKEVDKHMFLPERVGRSGRKIAPNFLWDNSAYVLGISVRDQSQPLYSQERFAAFREFNLKMIGDVDSVPAQAVARFLENYDPSAGRSHPIIASHLDAILESTGNFVFVVNEQFVHKDVLLHAIWEQHKATENAVYARCLVTGNKAPIERVHAKVKGVHNTNNRQGAIVSFNERAYESYNRKQGMNSPVSKSAAFAYTTALNYLLSRENENPPIMLGDTTAVYWAESDNPAYRDVYLGLADPAYVNVDEEDNKESGRDKSSENKLKHVAAKVKHGQPLDLTDLMEDLDPNTRFYVLGLAPNAARISVRFFHSDPFEKIVSRIMQHYEDLQIIKEFENQPSYLTVRDIVGETVSKKASNPKASPLLAGAVFRAVLTGAPYPAALYNAILIRIRADQGDSKIGYVRAAIIKACLIRKYRNQPEHAIQEVLQMSLNESSNNPAYVLGRIFAVLEKVQIEAINPKATIKDKYFTAACASPASVFPVLLRLSQHHLAKAEYGKNSDRRIQDILDLLDIETNPIPARLTLDEQGVFILGYYHQRAAFYQKSNNEATEVAAEA